MTDRAGVCRAPPGRRPCSASPARFGTATSRSRAAATATGTSRSSRCSSSRTAVMELCGFLATWPDADGAPRWTWCAARPPAACCSRSRSRASWASGGSSRRRCATRTGHRREFRRGFRIEAGRAGAAGGRHPDHGRLAARDAAADRGGRRDLVRPRCWSIGREACGRSRHRSPAAPTPRRRCGRSTSRPSSRGRRPARGAGTGSPLETTGSSGAATTRQPDGRGPRPARVRRGRSL